MDMTTTRRAFLSAGVFGFVLPSIHGHLSRESDPIPEKLTNVRGAGAAAYPTERGVQEVVRATETAVGQAFEYTDTDGETHVFEPQGNQFVLLQVVEGLGEQPAADDWSVGYLDPVTPEKRFLDITEVDIPTPNGHDTHAGYAHNASDIRWQGVLVFVLPRTATRSVLRLTLEDVFSTDLVGAAEFAE